MGNNMEKLVNVRYKFKDEKGFASVTITSNQYKNLQELPIIEKCEIVRGSV